MNFRSFEATRLHAVHVYPAGPGSLSIELVDGVGQVLDTASTVVPTGLSYWKTPIVLDFLVPPGNDYALRLNTTKTTIDLRSNTSGADYPFDTSSISIIGNSQDANGFYFFYDWLFTPARVGMDVVLENLTVDSNEVFEVRACRTATLGPDLEFLFPVMVEVEAGSLVIFEGAEVGANVPFEAAIDPALLPD